MPHVNVGDQRLWVTDKGKGSPVVLLHSLFFDARVFEPLEERLVEEHRVLAVDVRDHGRSEGPPREWTLRQAADEIQQALDELDAQAAHLVGLSMGGMIALRMALAHPERVRSLSLVSTSADTEPRAWLHKAMVETVRLGGRPATRLLLPYAVAQMFSKQARDSHAVDEWRQRIVAMDPQALHRAGQAVFDRESILDRVGEIDVPALVIVGEQDEAVPPEHGRQLAKGLPQAEFVEVSDAGHILPVEAPEVLGDELVHFLRRAEARAVRAGEDAVP